MMQSNKPKIKLATAAVGDKVKMVGDTMGRNFIVQQIRDDGYIELYCNGRPNVTAAPSTEIIFVSA